MIKRTLKSGVVAIARLMPARLMAHILFILRANPELTDRWGYHIRPINYYEPLPDFRKIKSSLLQRRRMSPAIDFRLQEQRALLERLAGRFAGEIADLASQPAPSGFAFLNEYFSGLDAAAYYAIIRDIAPGLVIEIGSGFSTQIASKALRRNAAEGHPGRLVCVEPYPEERLIQSGAQFELVQTPVQELAPEFFDQLGGGDILMIDSSHVATAGSDVCFEYLDILPRLKPGVWVHVHDVFFPTDYPAAWVIDRRTAFNEQYILEAFLAFNNSYAVQLANAWMWRDENAAARRLCPPAFDEAGLAGSPASFWMRRNL